MFRTSVPTLALMLAAAATAAAPTPSEKQVKVTMGEAQRILAAYEAASPPERDLAVFRLDWAASLREARARATKEKRPIFFVATMQLKDAGDLKGGHC
jgi:hypothetical protein